MAAGNAARVLRAPGRIVINPTDLDDFYPYGGTEIGKARLCVLQPLGTSFRVECEGLGEASDILEANNRWIFSCQLRGWDDDAVELLLPAGQEAGSTSGHKGFYVPGTATPGESALSHAVKLLYVPDDPIHVPAVLIYRGVPELAEGAEIAFQRGEEMVLPLTLDCFRDSNDNILRVGRLADLSLT